MSTKPNQSRPKDCQECKEKNLEADCWNPDRMLDALMRNHDKVEQDWVEKGLPKLVDEIMTNYQKFGGMDHLEGKDLPAKKVVIEVLEDLFTILFPGYLGDSEITKANVKYHLGTKLTSVYTQLTGEVEKRTSEAIFFKAGKTDFEPTLNAWSPKCKA